MQGSTPAAQVINKLNLKESMDTLFTLEALGKALQVVGILILGLVVVRIVVGLTRRLTRKTLSPRTSELLVKFVR